MLGREICVCVCVCASGCVCSLSLKGERSKRAFDLNQCLLIIKQLREEIGFLRWGELKSGFQKEIRVGLKSGWGTLREQIQCSV